MEKQISSPSLLTRREVCRQLRCSLGTLARLEIPYIRIRRRIYFRQESVNTWLSAQEQTKEAHS